VPEFALGATFVPLILTEKRLLAGVPAAKLSAACRAYSPATSMVKVSVPLKVIPVEIFILSEKSTRPREATVCAPAFAFANACKSGLTEPVGPVVPLLKGQFFNFCIFFF